MISKNISLLICLALTILVAPACKKDKEDPPPPSTENNPNDPTTTGSMTADVSGSTFQALEVSGRLGTNGSLWMYGSSDSHLDFSIANFGGPISYSLQPAWNNVASVSTGTNLFTTNESGGGALEITTYNETNNTISGTFEFVAGMLGSGGNTITVSEGVFTNVPLVQLPDPDVGQALYISSGNVIEPDAFRVHITDHYRFVVDIENNDLRWRYHTYANPTEDPLGYSGGRLLRQTIMTGSFISVYNNPNVEITEYNEEEEYVSGRIYLTQIDLDIKFNRIPLSPPTPVEPGQAVLNTPEGLIVFENAVYMFVYETESIRMEATNGDNQKIIVETPYAVGDYEPDHLYGRSATLKFYENASGPVTYTKYGFWKHYTASPGLHIGFVSNDENFSVKGFHVPN